MIKIPTDESKLAIRLNIGAANALANRDGPEVWNSDQPLKNSTEGIGGMSHIPRGSKDNVNPGRTMLNLVFFTILHNSLRTIHEYIYQPLPIK